MQCEATIYFGSQCSLTAARFRESRMVCGVHMQPRVKVRYIDDGFDRIGIYAAVMAKALGDDHGAPPAYLDGLAQLRHPATRHDDRLTNTTAPSNADDRTTGASRASKRPGPESKSGPGRPGR